MADENVIIEDNEQNVGEYDPNPYDNVTVEEALKQLFNRFTPRTVRQAIFTMAENNKPATLIEKTVTSNDTYVATDDDADGYSKVTVDVAGGGGGETFEVEMEFNGSTTTFTSTKNYQQIKNAYDNGDVVDGTFTAILDDNRQIVCENCYWKEHYIEGIRANTITIFCYPKVSPTNSMASIVAIFAEDGKAYLNLGEAYEIPVTPAT